MDTSDGFSPGPRLSDAPQGDVARQAVASLKGYAFQLYGSVLAWLELKDGEDLFLEVAEDYAVVAREALKAVQAKETRASGSVTLNTADVKDAINSFVDLRNRNPARTVSLRYFTTSPIGLEKEAADRVEGMSGLDYWRSVARGADVAPLRARLLRLDLKQQTRAYIERCGDEEFRDRLIRRITWDCGHGGLKDLEAEIEAKLLRLALSGIRIRPDQVRRVTGALVEQALRTAISAPPRRLSTADLYSPNSGRDSYTDPHLQSGGTHQHGDGAGRGHPSTRLGPLLVVALCPRRASIASAPTPPSDACRLYTGSA